MTAPFVPPAVPLLPPPAPPPEAEAERMGTADWTVLTPVRQAAFLDQLAATGEVRAAARAAGVSPQTAYRARRKSAAFALAWDTACLAARPIAQDTLASRAIDGVEEPVFYHGEEIARRRRYDARLLLAHLARLDKLAERAELAAALPRLDEAIDALREGGDIESLMRDAGAGEAAADAAGGGAGDLPHDRVPGVPSSSAKRGEEPDDEDGSEDESCPECGGACLHPDPEVARSGCPVYEERIEEMYAAFPDDPPSLDDLSVAEAEAIEAAQLAAFEAGFERWWEVVARADARAAAGEG